jgi:hypothetical protein
VRCEEKEEWIVSFQSREKKRRYKQAVKRSRREHAGETAHRWSLTLAPRKGAVCACCARNLRKGGEMVYRHEPAELRCVECGRREPDSKGFRPSLRWERAQRAKRGRAAA